jgi:hypothetical protein
MATITVDKALGLDMRAISFEGLLHGSDYVSNSSLYRIYYGSSYYEEFRGTGFRYNGSGEPIGGTVNTYFVSFEGKRVLTLEGVKIASTAIYKAALSISLADDNKVIGTDGFHKKAGELRYTKSGGDTFVHADTNGDGTADFSVRFDALINFTKGDFIL